jgi:hypothetical protein
LLPAGIIKQPYNEWTGSQNKGNYDPGNPIEVGNDGADSGLTAIPSPEFKAVSISCVSASLQLPAQPNNPAENVKSGGGGAPLGSLISNFKVSSSRMN